MKLKLVRGFLAVLMLTQQLCVLCDGHKFCFRSRDSTKCQDPLIQPFDPLPARNSNCCLSKDAMYYVEKDVPSVGFLFMKLYANKGIENCLPCPSNTRTSGTCSRRCPPGKFCAVRHGKEKCLCNRSCQSAQSKSKVCGRDNKTYKHECDLLRKACQNRHDNSVAYDGPCQTGCSQVKCRGNYTCITDQYDKAHCISCDTLPCSNASKADGPVCGADWVQYSSSCALRLETCRQGKSIGVAYYGNCIANATCDDITCGDNICVMDPAGRPRCISCSCREDHAYRNGHDTTIDQKGKSVCGTDLRTYRSYCSLRQQVCETKTFIEVKHQGSCPGDSLSQPEDQQITTAPQQCDQVEKYYITLEDFKTILQQDLGLNVTSNKQPDQKDKIVFMRALIVMLKKKWKKIQNSP